ncbi:hypothetical protein KXD40_007204 [Peronospora effusa]|nr:hypothetical protein KXD40_007204 [Peronospora effusa]
MDINDFTELKQRQTAQDEVLNVIFRLKHKTPSDRQDTSLCETLVNQFTTFIETIDAVQEFNCCCGRVDPLVDDRIVPVGDFTVHEVNVLQDICRRLKSPNDVIHKRGDIWYDPWLPSCGCALQRTKINAAMIKLHVIFVDEWGRTLHFVPTGTCVHSAVSKTYHKIHCADLDSALEEKFEEMFATKLAKRTARFRQLGHQKTPQFIAAVVRRAVAAVMRRAVTNMSEEGDDKEDVDDEMISPQGGTTDVGQHTGGRPRDSCWPIVRATIEDNLCCGEGLFRKTMVMFQLSLLQAAVLETQSSFDRGICTRDGCDAVNDLFFMLQVVIEATVNLLDCGYNISALLDQYRNLRATIDGFVDFLNHKIAICYQLPDRAKMQQLHTLDGGMQVDSPKRENVSSLAASEEERRLRVVTNLEGCWHLDGVTCSLNALLCWEKSSDASKSCKCILVLRTIESFMFARSVKLSTEDEHPFFDNDEEFIENIKSLVTVYQKNICEWRRLSQSTSFLDVEQRSREMLVMWIAFCLVHQKCVRQVPLCAEYNIALDWQDLKVAVISDRVAMSALQHVSKYIRWWNEKTRGLQLFHLTNQDPTFGFAQRFALSSSSMMDIYNRDVESWERHKKSRVAEIRTQLSSLEDELQSKHRELADENARLNDEHTANIPARSKLKDDIVSINSRIKRAKELLRQELATPRPLVRPLPAAKDDAIQIIFMLTMPRDIELLGSLCLTAQRALATTNRPYMHQFTDVAKPIAEHLLAEDESKHSPDQIATFRQKKCILYGYALLAYTLGPLDDAACQEVCELIVLFRSSFLCAAIIAPSTEHMLCVESKITEMMTRRIADLIKYVKKSKGSALTTLVSLVSPTSPGQLEWKQTCEPLPDKEIFGTCFESSGAQYAVNLFTNIGLTGTNDNHRLLPLSVAQEEPNWSIEVHRLDNSEQTLRSISLTTQVTRSV